MISLTTEEKYQTDQIIAKRLVDRGEVEAIVLSKSLGAQWFLTDDSKARKIAVKNNLVVHGSIGDILWSARSGYLSKNEVLDAIVGLNKSTLWISQKVMVETLSILGRIFENK